MPISDKQGQEESGAKSTDSLEKVAKDAGLDPKKVVDYRDVDQGTNVEPIFQTTAEATDAPKKGKGNKDKASKEDKTFKKRTIREEARCSFCSNLMTQSSKMNFHELKGYRIPKRADGKTPAFKSPPGAPAGKVVAVFCDDCEAVYQSGVSYRDFRTALIETDDGTIENIPITNLNV